MMTEATAARIDVRRRTGRARAFAFLGPATLVSVGYMDPGNWATDVEGGARFGHQLLWVLVAANLAALLMQALATRLGVAAGNDLARACREAYSRPVAIALWVLAEVAIIACDLAEVLGSALALNLLFGWPLLQGALVTALDVFLVLALQRCGVRALEAVILVLIGTVGSCLAIELWLAGPRPEEVVSGLVPRIDDASLLLAIGILGATLMPHNLYLHSALVGTRVVAPDRASRKAAMRGFLFDTAIALNLALLVNAALLLLAAATFHRHGIVVDDLREAHRLLDPLLGTALASTLFAVALLAAGQSATITGTLAGQVVMEGFLHWRLPPAVRRLVTRSLALVPAVVVLGVQGDAGVLPLLVASQVVLSLQLPFAIVPLLRLTGSPAWMGDFASPRTVRIGAWSCAALIVAANGYLVVRTVTELAERSPWIAAAGAAVALGAAGLLGWITRVRLRFPRPSGHQGLPGPDGPATVD